MKVKFRHIYILLIVLCAAQINAQEIHDSLRIHFQQDKSMFNEAVADNSNFNGSLLDLLEMSNRKDVEIVNISIYGGASPEGGIEHNLNLSKRRAERLATFIESIGGGIPLIITKIGRDWNGLFSLAANDAAIPAREETIKILQALIAKPDKSTENRLFTELKKLHNGATYKYLYDKYFPELRKAWVTVEFIYRIGDYIYAETPNVNVYHISAKEIELLPQVPESSVNTTKRPPLYIGVKTNMLYDATLVPNIGMELYLGKNWSIDAYWMYAWWKSDRVHNYWRTYGGDIELRKWFGKAAENKPLTGHHIGVYAQMLTYDFELGGRGYLGDRWSYAAGVSYGYSMPLTRRLNIDFSIGLGYLGGKYKEYLPLDGHYVWQSTNRRHWFGPTKAEISLVWLIGRGNINETK